MNIKVTEKILSIPPYISTSWVRIAALHIKGGVLAITLYDGDTVHIPNLTSEAIQSIFHYHAIFLEKEEIPQLGIKESGQEDHPIRMTFGSSLEGLGNMHNMMQHNPNQADAPDIPNEILQKITAITRIISPPEELQASKAEEGCNCFFCQIARVLNPSAAIQNKEDVVKDDELQFQQWSILQTGEKLFSVTNRLDGLEKYNVFLGQPVGCTCGQEGCEHILAVLKS